MRASPAPGDVQRGTTSPTNNTMPVGMYNPQTGTYAQSTPNMASSLPGLANQVIPEGQTRSSAPVPQSGRQGGGAVAPSNGGDPLARIEQLQGQYEPTPEGFRQIVAQLQREGYPIVAATHGVNGSEMSDDAIVLPNGAVYDIISAVGAPNAAWSMAHTDNYDPNRQVVGPNGRTSSFGEFLEGAGLPPSTAVPFAGKGGGGLAGGSLVGGSGAGGAAPGLSGGQDPSYGFRFDEGIKALQRSAAAKGTLLTGGTAKALERYGQEMASQEYGNVFDRNYKLAGLGLNAAGTGAQLASSYGSQAGSLAGNQASGNNALTGNQAGNLGDLSNAYGGNLSNLITGIGNVNAAGQIGSANAWTGNLGNLTKLFGDWAADQMKKRGAAPAVVPARTDGTV